jgi:hypothetical protein
MPAKKEEKSQSVKVNINLGETKKPRKPRGKRKPSQKKLPSVPMTYPRTFPQAQYSQQPQYIPLYVNQYPSFAGAGTLNYMNSGIPANPQLLAGTSTAPLLLGNGTTTPTTAMTRMTSNGKFNIPQSFYVPAEKPNYPRIDIKKRIEDINRPKMITQTEIPNIGNEEFERRRENILKFTGNYQRPTITEFDEETGLPIKNREYGFADRRQEQAFIDLNGILNLVPPNSPSRSSSISLESQYLATPSEMQRAMDLFQEDDADEGFFSSSNTSVDDMPSLEQIPRIPLPPPPRVRLAPPPRIPLAPPPPPLSSAPPSYADVMFYDYLRPELEKLPAEETIRKENLIETFIPYSYGDEEDLEFEDAREGYKVANPLFA